MLPPRVVSPQHAPARSTPKHEQVVGFDDFKALQQTKGMGDVKAAGKYRQVPASVRDTRTFLAGRCALSVESDNSGLGRRASLTSWLTATSSISNST
jgi:hypothetical protein